MPKSENLMVEMGGGFACLLATGHKPRWKFSGRWDWAGNVAVRWSGRSEEAPTASGNAVPSMQLVALAGCECRRSPRVWGKPPA